MKDKGVNFPILGLLIVLFSANVLAQDGYKIHSHNDYAQELPFWEAYTHGASSIEADVFLKNNQLYVTHAEDEIVESKTLKSLYLDPISELVQDDEFRELQLLIDVKSEAKPTLKKLIEVLEDYPELKRNTQLTMVISGNRPVPSAYKNYPNFIQFDHQNMNNLDDLSLEKVALISQNFRDYSVWNGLGKLTKLDLKKIKALIEKAHSAGKPFRFWGTPAPKKPGADSLKWAWILSIPIIQLKQQHI